MSVSSVGPAAGVCLCLCGTHWISPKHTCSHKQTHKTTTVFVLLKRTNVSSDINYTQLVKADEQWGKRDPDVPPLIPSVHKMFHLNQVILIMKDVGKLIIQLSHVHLVLHRGVQPVVPEPHVTLYQLPVWRKQLWLKQPVNFQHCLQTLSLLHISFSEIRFKPICKTKTVHIACR